MTIEVAEGVPSAKKRKVRSQLATEAERELYDELCSVTWGYMHEPALLEPEDKRAIKEAIVLAIQTGDAGRIVDCVEQYDQISDEPHPCGERGRGYEHSRACLRIDLEDMLRPEKDTKVA